ncbi:hypothetical protein OIDMADRAFT_99796 [Oidiodendron maius Zn]|uniref:Serine/threonine-protein phosphatase 4 regulatory subunit 3-like central domain-containing protein n=1 Tax=Oidiodendron maius (strain Zn) TaxID=913774 RepID=A0A0C3HXZ7_OIDMZ|nr:hypothetical protein OIDMADRAFT_99796 [Oidiodendron maius Zn]
MALSFQESEGCQLIWKFVSSIQHQLFAVNGPDEALEDDIPIDTFQSPISLPSPTLGNLPDVETQMRGLINTQNGRDALTKFVLTDDYIRKLIPLVEMAEDMEDLTSLHRLCNVMKIMILLNDTTIIEHAVTDDMVLGVVGALEYDPDFPSHKANHRRWLSKEGRYKEVVRIDDEQVRKKIHHTYRLQYLKDVVLARILDDPTFSVLNSLIFFNQVDIVQHLQLNAPFLKDLFGIFGPLEKDEERKKEAVLFIQQCCAIAKNLQQPVRQQLYNHFLGHGLLSVINFALRHSDVAVRVGATDVLVSMIDHDPQMIRQTIFRQINEKQPPLTDSLIDLLLVEADFGVKAQIADAIKVLLDPGVIANNPPMEGIPKMSVADLAARVRPENQQVVFLKDFYDKSARKLFKPITDLEGRKDMDFSVHQVSLFIYLIDILCFFIRQHPYPSKFFVLTENLAPRISQLFASREKYLKLAALKFFRSVIGLQDEFYGRAISTEQPFGPILDIIIETMPRDNLLSSACLELFDFIKAQGIKPLIRHLVESHREKMQCITYVDTFKSFISRYDATQGFTPSLDTSFYAPDEDKLRRPETTGRGSRWETGVKDLDAAEEAYFNASDDDEAQEHTPTKSAGGRTSTNGASPRTKPLVDYNSDDENESAGSEIPADVPQSNGNTPGTLAPKTSEDEKVSSPSSTASNPPERLSEKRRREEDEEDELGKLSQSKRRSSSASSAGTATGNVLRRRRSFTNNTPNNSGKAGKIAISLSSAIKTGGDNRGGDSTG